MIAPVPQSSSQSPAEAGAGETSPLLGPSRHQHVKHGSWLYRARRAPLAVACVVAMALFTDMVVYGVVVPLLPIIVRERLGGSSSDVGLLFACYAIGLLASTPFFAILSDKYQNRRIPMMVGMLGLAVATIGFSLASNYWVLIIARIGQGSAGGASWTIGLGMLADVYPPDNLGVVMGACMMANAIGFMMGPMVGAYFYEYHGYAAPFIFCAALAIIDFLCIVFIAEPEKKKRTSSGSDNGSRSSSSNSSNVSEHSSDAGEHGTRRSGPSTDQEVDALTIASTDGAGEVPTTQTMVAVERTLAVMSDPVKTQGILEDALHHEQHVKERQEQDHLLPQRPNGAPSATHEGYGTVSANQESDESNDGDVSMLQIASDWTIICCLLATFVAASVFSGLEPIFPLYLQDLLNATPTQTGLVLTAAIFPTLFASGIGYVADRTGHFYVSLVGMVLFAIATFALALPRSFLGFIIPLAIFGLGSSTILTPLLPAMAEVVNQKGWNAYAKTYALYNMTYSLSMAVGPILAGYVYDKFGFRWTMIMFGCMTVVSTPVIFSAQIAGLLAKFRGSASTTRALNV